MLSELFTSKTRIKVLLKLFLNPNVSSYLRELSSEFKLSPNALKTELDNLSEAGYLTRTQSGRNVFFQANKKHPFFPGDQLHRPQVPGHRPLDRRGGQEPRQGRRGLYSG